MNKDYLFEVSWEVCNKVGGIYTVLSTKSKQAIEHFGDNYITIGPALNRNPGFIPETSNDFTKSAKKISEKGINIRIGRWDIAGKPRCILVGFHEAFPQQDKLLYELSLPGVKDINDVLIIVGGNIPRRDIDGLQTLGVRGVFPTGSKFEDIIEFIRRNAG